MHYTLSRVLRAAVVVTFLGACADDPAPLAIEYVDDSDAAAGKADEADEPQVELKLTLPAEEIARAVTRFKLSDAKATLREVTFYDDAWLSLFEAGLILRSRKVIDGPDDSTVKVRPLEAGEVHPSWFELDGFKCEEDRVGTQGIASCSLTVPQDAGEIDAVADGERAITKLFSEDQEVFAEAYGSELDWSALEVLGPVQTRVWRIKASGFAHRLTFERWVLPDGSDMLEVSCRVAVAEADAVQADLTGFLARRGFSASPDQETKTKAALSYFASALY